MDVKSYARLGCIKNLLEDLVKKQGVGNEALINKLTEVSSKITEVKTEVSAIKENTDTVETKLQSANDKLEIIKNNTNNTNVKLQSINDDLNTAKEELKANINANTTKLETKLTSIVSELEGLETLLQREFDQTQAILTDIKGLLTTSCDNPLNVNVCNQISLDTLNAKMDTMIGLLTSIATPLTANEYDETESCCGGTNDNTNTNGGTNNTEDEIIYCYRNKADIILSESYTDGENDIFEEVMLLEFSKYVSDDNFNIKSIVTNEDGTISEEENTISGSNRYPQYAWNVKRADFAKYPKVELICNDPRVNGKAVFKYGVRQDCVKKIDTTIRPDDMVDILIDDINYGSVRVFTSREVSTPVEVQVTMNGITITKQVNHRGSSFNTDEYNLTDQAIQSDYFPVETRFVTTDPRVNNKDFTQTVNMGIGIP